MAAAPVSPMIPPPGAPDFLAAQGWAGAAILPLAGDASFRRYFRVIDGGRSAVLMDAPPEHEDVRPFLNIAGHLAERGLSAPRSLGVDLDQGLLLLEDFGDALLGPRLAAGATAERPAYERAVDILLHLRGLPAPEGLAAYDAEVMRREVALFIDWYAPAMDLQVDRAGFLAAWEACWAEAERAARDYRALVLRDYHVDNLMLLDRPGIAGLGLLDFQDALAGHPAYDLVSLLQDARRDVAPALEAALIERYLAASGDGADAFRAHYEVLGAQRNTKILGIFTRLWQRDGKTNYLRHQPRVWGYLERNFAHPALAPVAQWFEANVPIEKRAEAWRRHD